MSETFRKAAFQEISKIGWDSSDLLYLALELLEKEGLDSSFMFELKMSIRFHAQSRLQEAFQEALGSIVNNRTTKLFSENVCVNARSLLRTINTDFSRASEEQRGSFYEDAKLLIERATKEFDKDKWIFTKDGPCGEALKLFELSKQKI